MAAPGGQTLAYGFGVWPVYLTGQPTWYSDGLVVNVMVDPKYSGPLLVRASQLDGDRKSRISLSDFDLIDPQGAALKERFHGVLVVSAVHTSGSTLELQAVPASTLWREWLGWLSTDGAGCFGVQVDGLTFTEIIVLVVLAGSPPH